ncbi:MAG: PAS domain S-box protein [Bacteroidota bacterium]
MDEAAQLRQLREQCRQLREENERHKLIIKNISEGIIISDLNNNITYVNERMSELSGYAADEIVGKKTDAILIHRDKVKNIEDKIKKSFGGKEVVYEVEHRRKDSGEYWCAQTRVTPFKDHKGEIVGAIGIITNITELKEAQKALKESEERYRLLFEHAFDGIILFDTRKNRPITCNNKVLEFFNCTEQAFYDASPLDLSPEFQEDGTPSVEARAKLLEQLEREHQIRYEWVHQRSDGKLINTEIYTFTLPKPNQHLRISVLKDISERKKNRKAIKESEERLRMALDGAQLGTWDWDMQTGATTYNRRWAEMLGYSLEEIEPTHMSFNRLVHPDDLDLVRAAMQEHINNHTPFFEAEIRMISKSGEIRWIYDRGRVSTYDEQRQPIRASGIHVDLTQIKKYELEIKQSEESFRKLFEQSPFGIMLRELHEDHFRQVNQKACEMFGYSREEMTQLPREELIHIEDESMREQQTQRLLAGEISSFQLEKQYRKKNGETFWAVATRSLVQINGHTSIIGFVEDISQRKLAEAALKKSTERLKEAQQLANLGYWDVNLETGKVRWSEETRRMFGLRSEEAEPSIEEYLEMVHPDDKESVLQAIREGIINKEPNELEVRHYTKSGRLIYNISKGKPLLRDGQVVKLWGTIQDITQQKNIDLALHETNKKYIDLFENMYDALLITNEEGRFVDANKAAQRLLGYSFKEITQLRIPQIIHPDDTEKSQRYLKKLLTQGYYSNYQGRIITKNGEVKFLQVNSNAVLDKNGKLIGSRDIARDITALKEAEVRREQLLKELEEANRDLKDFAYIVSHDLKAPLRAISSLAQWLAEDYSDRLDDNGKMQLQLLTSRVSRMHNFIEGILEYSRIGRVAVDREEVDLNLLVEEINDSLSPPSHFRIILVDQLPAIHAEKIRMKQIFQNLISNAIKYNDKEQGWVKISYKEQDDFHCFRVSDNGKGIEERYFEKIFQIFQTLQARDKFESTGIGLTIVKRIVQLYGGQIEPSSQPGKGTTFEFTLKK